MTDPKSINPAVAYKAYAAALNSSRAAYLAYRDAETPKTKAAWKAAYKVADKALKVVREMEDTK